MDLARSWVISSTGFRSRARKTLAKLMIPEKWARSPHARICEIRRCFRACLAVTPLTRCSSKLASPSSRRAPVSDSPVTGIELLRGPEIYTGTSARSCPRGRCTSRRSFCSPIADARRPRRERWRPHSQASLLKLTRRYTSHRSSALTTWRRQGPNGNIADTPTR